jgi:amino acid transporter
VMALIALRRRQPALSRPFRMPWYPVLPAALLVCHGLLVAAVLIAQPELLAAAAVGTALLVGSAVAVSVLLPRRRPAPATPDSR